MICCGSTKGLTEYLGDVLTARSGLQTHEQWREEFAGAGGDVRDTGRAAIGVRCRIRQTPRRSFTTPERLGQLAARHGFLRRRRTAVAGRGHDSCGD